MCCVPPHPYPLPKERETRCHSQNQSGIDLMRTGGGSPSPWGEGRGEGELDRRQNRISEMQSSATHRNCRGSKKVHEAQPFPRQVIPLQYVACRTSPCHPCVSLV